MCGIAGRVGSSDHSQPTLEAMVATLHHRGPDDRGYFRAPGVELGMARLAIVDVASGQQPTHDNSGAITAIFNGEIYNFAELRANLIKEGYRFKSNGDCEVIANLYHRHGQNFVTYLRGMFAIAIWDSRDQSLHLVRDRVGKKPLLYSQTSEGIIFASEARALLKAGVSNEVNPHAIHEVMAFGYVNAPRTIYRSISALEPATILTFKQNQISMERYWHLDLSTKEKWDEERSLTEVQNSLREAVTIRTNFERRAGAYLSGGVDSSLVTKYLAETSPQGLNTYSVRLPHQSFDESGYAQSVAKQIGTTHHTLDLEVTKNSLVEVLESLDQPFADSSYFATYYLNKAASAHIVVAFGGDGGDEAMAGYDRYRAAVALQRFNPLLAIGTPIKPLLRSLGRKGTRLAEQLRREPSLADRYIDMVALNREGALTGLLSPELRSGARHELLATFGGSQGMNEIERLVAVDFASYLPGDLLVKADWAAMAHSVELRSPMLDHRFLELCAKVPTRFRSNFRGGKLLLKKLATHEIPGIDFHRSKMGFGIPRADWMRGPFLPILEEILLSESCKNRGWFDAKQLRHEIELHKSGNNRDNILWPALIIESWAQRWL